jgi:hypothetical protein
MTETFSMRKVEAINFFPLLVCLHPLSNHPHFRSFSGALSPMDPPSQHPFSIIWNGSIDILTLNLELSGWKQIWRNRRLANLEFDGEA